jgi:hypothetical protein
LKSASTASSAGGNRLGLERVMTEGGRLVWRPDPATPGPPRLDVPATTREMPEARPKRAPPTPVPAGLVDFWYIGIREPDGRITRPKGFQ